MLLLLQNICSFCQNCCFSLSVAELVRCFCRQVHWRALHCEALQCIALWSASTLWKALHCGSVGCGEDAMCILKHQCIVEQSSTYRYRELESNIFGTGIKYIWGRICIVSWYGNLHTYKSRHCIIVDVAVTNPIISVRLSKYQEEWQHRPSHLKGHPLTCDRSQHVVTCVTFH